MHPVKRSSGFPGNVDHGYTRAPRTAGPLPTTISGPTNTPSGFDRRQATSLASSASSRFTGITSRTSRTTATRASPTFTTAPTQTKSPFHLTTLAAIIIPALIVLIILLWAFRRWRRIVAAQSGGGVIVVQHPPDQKTWTPPHQHGGSFNAATRVDNAFDRPIHSGPVAPQPMPGPGSGYHPGNASMQGNWAPGHPPGGGTLHPAQAQTWNPDYGQQNQAYGQQNDVYNQQHQSYGPQNDVYHQRHPSFSPQSHHHEQSHDYGQQTHTIPASQAQQPIVTPAPQPQRPTASQSHVDLQPTIPLLQPQQPIASQSSISLKPQAEKGGEVVLTWTPDTGTSSSTAAAPPPPAQPAGPPNSGTEAQSPGNPELHMLRERVQLLEAALVVQPTAHDDEPDRPPPAYDEHPDQVVDSRTGGRS